MATDRPAPSPSLPESFDVTCVSTRALSPRVREVGLARADKKPFAFEAGQWVQLRFPFDDDKGRPLRRAYSIASPPRPGDPRFELAVTRVEGGPGSTYLHQMKVGDTLGARGPEGTFTRPLGAERPALFIAAGTGLAPFRSMVLDAVARGRTTPMWILFGARTPEDVLYGEELAAVAQAHPFVRLEVTLSRAEAGWSGRRGYVQAHAAELFGALSQQADEVQVWICGLNEMVSACRALLKQDFGLDRKRFHVERYD